VKVADLLLTDFDGWIDTDHEMKGN
jgi:hypothetical protein